MTATETKKKLIGFINSVKCTENAYRCRVWALPEHAESSHSLLKTSNTVGHSDVDVTSHWRHFQTRGS